MFRVQYYSVKDTSCKCRHRNVNQYQINLYANESSIIANDQSSDGVEIKCNKLITHEQHQKMKFYENCGVGILLQLV